MSPKIRADVFAGRFLVLVEALIPPRNKPLALIGPPTAHGYADPAATGVIDRGQREMSESTGMNSALARLGPLVLHLTRLSARLPPLLLELLLSA